MYQSFNTDLADKIGLKEAIVVQVLAYRIMNAKKLGLSLHYNEYWETAGIKELSSQLFPYIHERVFRRVMDALVSMNILKYTYPPISKIIGRKSKWYTFSDYGWRLLKDYNII